MNGPPPTIPRLSGALTVLLALLFALSVGWDAMKPSKGAVAELERPFLSAVMSQEQMLILASVKAEGFWPRLRASSVGIEERPLEVALRAYDDVLSLETGGRGDPTSVAILARKAVALAKLGRHSEAQTVLQSVARISSEGARLSRLISYALLGASHRPTEAEVEPALAALAIDGYRTPDWTRAQIAMGFFERTGRASDAATARSTLQQRATRLNARATILTILFLVPPALGLLLLGWAAITGFRLLRPVSAAAIPPPWSLAAGSAVTLRLLVLGALAAGGLTYLTVKLLGPAGEPLFFVWNGVIAGLYLAFFLRRGPGLLATFGLRPCRPLPAVLAFTLVLIALDHSTAQLMSVVADLVGYQSSWTARVHEDMSTGPPDVVLTTALVAIIAAPVSEELLFRGVIYGSLRSRFGPAMSAAVSAALFAAAHGYSPYNNLVMFTGAVLSAIVYEKSRSLLPCMLDHMAHNALVVATGLLLVRPAG